MAQDTYPPVEDTARIDLQFVLRGVFANIEMENSYYINNDVATRDTSYFGGLVARFRDAWDDEMKDAFTTDMQLVNVKATDLDTVLHPSVDLPCDIVGTSSADALPATVCAVARLVGEIGGTPKKSYVRLGPIAEASVQGNYIDSGSLDDYLTHFNAFIDAAGSGTGDSIVIVSVYEPDGTEPNIYRDAGVVNNVAFAGIRPLVGRSASRLT